jgi:rhodanese-related sulfurtransferase
MASNRISPEEVNARALGGEPIVFVDARNDQAWGSSERKIPGSVRMPVGDVETHLSELDRTATIIAYCSSPNEESSTRVALSLKENGFRRIFALRGGFNAWVAAGYPLEPKSKAA